MSPLLARHTKKEARRNGLQDRDRVIVACLVTSRGRGSTARPSGRRLVGPLAAYQHIRNLHHAHAGRNRGAHVDGEVDVILSRHVRPRERNHSIAPLRYQTNPRSTSKAARRNKVIAPYALDIASDLFAAISKGIAARTHLRNQYGTLCGQMH